MARPDDRRFRVSEATTPRRAPIGAILAIVGGALLVIGSFLSWAEFSGAGQSEVVSGVDMTDGWVTVVAGLVVVAVGIAATTAPQLRPLAVAAGIVGAFGVGFGLFDALTLTDSALDSVAEETAMATSVSFQELRALLDVLIDSGQIGISMGIGLYVVIAGGVIAVVGAGVQLASARVQADEVPSSIQIAPSDPGPSV
jgi:hypothetical protein